MAKKGSNYRTKIKERREQSPDKVDWDLAVEGIESAYDWVTELLQKRQRAMAQIELLIDDIGSKKVDLKGAQSQLRSILKTLE
tara:strand:+ start:274 stop:522 length:249 start_codon:yes stop_codon:yes gene_type:complete